MAGEQEERSEERALAVTPVWQFGEDWIAGQRSEQTRRAYASDWRMFQEFCARPPADASGAPLVQMVQHARDVRMGGVVAFRNWRHAQGDANTTIARRLSAIRAALDYAVAAGFLASNPAKLVKAYRVSGQSPRHALTNAEARDLLAAPNQSTIAGARDYAVLMTLLYLALRRAEAGALRCGDLTYEESQVVLTIHGKGGYTDTLPVPPRVAEAIRAYLTRDGRGDFAPDSPWRARPPTEPLFRRLKNPAHGHDLTDCLTGGMVWRIVKRYARAAGLEERGRMDAHTLRHTAISNALRHHATVDRVRVMARHKASATTLRYATYQDSLADSAVHQVNYQD